MILEKEGDLFIDVKVIPKSSINALEFTGDALRLKISAPPIDGEANKKTLVFLSKCLKISKNRISLVRGEGSKNKLIKITGLNKDDFMELIAQ
jgi:uncharacterized protein (TIGR00251 family)